MIIVLMFATLFIISSVMLCVAYRNDWDEFGWMAASITFGLILLFVLILLPIMRVGSLSEISEFNSVIDSLEVARGGNVSEFELAAIQQEIIEMNKWLASAQFWAKHPLTNWFLHGDILKLEPIR